MDIVSRIKTFMSQNSIGSSIFADKCDIPRPTLSQLLNGRNKKVSNEVLDKIHLAYPELSMMWLIFDEVLPIWKLIGIIIIIVGLFISQKVGKR